MSDALRQQRGLTQEKLAFEAEIDLTYVGGIERGKRNPSLMVMARIAECPVSPASEAFESTGGFGGRRGAYDSNLDHRSQSPSYHANFMTGSSQLSTKAPISHQSVTDNFPTHRREPASRRAAPLL
jgi:transcriptional regulator with XRE-family HTH domain